MLTTNREPKDFYPPCPTPVLAEGLLDRLLNSAYVIPLLGRSYHPQQRLGRLTGPTGPNIPQEPGRPAGATAGTATSGYVNCGARSIPYEKGHFRQKQRSRKYGVARARSGLARTCVAHCGPCSVSYSAVRSGYPGMRRPWRRSHRSRQLSSIDRLLGGVADPKTVGRSQRRLRWGQHGGRTRWIDRQAVGNLRRCCRQAERPFQISVRAIRDSDEDDDDPRGGMSAAPSAGCATLSRTPGSGSTPAAGQSAQSGTATRTLGSSAAAQTPDANRPPAVTCTPRPTETPRTGRA